jgi:hypothetical protein
VWFSPLHGDWDRCRSGLWSLLGLPQVHRQRYNVSVPVDVASFKLLSGNPKGFAKTADSGNVLTRHFCPDCGSPLFTSSPHHPDRVYVKAGAFDDPSVVVPAYQSWVSSSVPWSNIPPWLPGYAGSFTSVTRCPRAVSSSPNTGSGRRKKPSPASSIGF